jgi:hypothetical protein
VEELPGKIRPEAANGLCGMSAKKMTYSERFHHMNRVTDEVADERIWLQVPIKMAVLMSIQMFGISDDCMEVHDRVLQVS